MAVRDRIIGAGFAGLGATGLHRLAAPVTRGLGALLMFHRVTSPRRDSPGYAPNGLLEITPDFLDRVLLLAKRRGFAIVTLDEALRRLAGGGDRFVALTFDDAYRDTLDEALPVLERRQAPFTMFVATGFADRSAGLWWVELEEIVRRANVVEWSEAGAKRSLAAGSAAEKSTAFAALYRSLRAGPEERLLGEIATLRQRWGVDGRAIADALCLDWQKIERLARHELATIGAHSVRHLMLAKWDVETARREMADSKAALEARIGAPVRHFAYPVGDPGSAGPREFALAREAGFASAVTTRPGMLFAGHAAHPHALPRLSINGNWQDERYIDLLLSGAPFALWNRGRRLNVA